MAKKSSNGGTALAEPSAGTDAGGSATPAAGASSGGESGEGGESGGESSGESGKRNTRPSMEKVSRNLRAIYKDMESRDDLGDEDKRQILDGLRGLQILVDTRETIVDSKSPPQTESAWGRVIELGRQAVRAKSIF